ncbi:unnamed protein product [Lathyrus sativus]|nr:unnamed protein product [Lathyrus sativus]
MPEDNNLESCLEHSRCRVVLAAAGPKITCHRRSLNLTTLSFKIGAPITPSPSE